MSERDYEGLNRFLNNLGTGARVTVEMIGSGREHVGELETNDLDVIVLRKDRGSILIRKDAIATVRHSPHQSSIPMA